MTASVRSPRPFSRLQSRGFVAAPVVLHSQLHPVVVVAVFVVVCAVSAVVPGSVGG